MVSSRHCETAKPGFQNSRLRLNKNSRHRDAKSPKNKILRPVTNAFN